MEQPLIAIAAALILGVIAWKVLKGIVKFGILVLVVGGAAWFVSQGGFA